MWNVKTFKSAHDQANWIGAHQHKFQITVLYVNNGFAVEYRRLRRVY